MAASRVRRKEGHGSNRDELDVKMGSVSVGVIRRRSRQIIIPEMIFSPFISLRRLPQLNLSDLEEEDDDDEEEMEKKKDGENRK